MGAQEVNKREKEAREALARKSGKNTDDPDDVGVKVNKRGAHMLDGATSHKHCGLGDTFRELKRKK